MAGPNSQGPGPQNLTANALKSATTVVNVSSATAPTSGQILTATSGSAATWQSPGGGSGTVTSVSVVTANGFSGSVATATTTPAITLSYANTGTIGNLLLSSTSVNLNEGTGAKQTLYTCPANRRCIVTNVVMQKLSGTLTAASLNIGWNASANDVSFPTINLAGLNNAPSASNATLFATGDIVNAIGLLQGTVAIGTAGDVLGLKVTTPEGSALTARVDVFGYLTDTSGVPVANILIP